MPRGFAAMVKKDPDRQRQIASAGGRRAHQLGTAHEFTEDEAKVAGRKGGQISGRLRSEEHFHQIDKKVTRNPVADDVDLHNEKNIDVYVVNAQQPGEDQSDLSDIKEGK